MTGGFDEAAMFHGIATYILRPGVNVYAGQLLTFGQLRPDTRYWRRRAEWARRRFNRREWVW